MSIYQSSPVQSGKKKKKKKKKIRSWKAFFFWWVVFQLAPSFPKNIYQSLGSEVTPWSGGGLVAMQIPTQIFCLETKNTIT